MNTKKILLSLCAILTLTAGIVFSVRYFSAQHDKALAAKALYYCPMHVTYTSDKPGDCPICGMNLVKKEQQPETAAGERKIKFYRNPMNPEVTSKVFMKDEMGMDYIPVYEDITPASSDDRSTIKLDAAKQQLIGMEVSAVKYRKLIYTIRASGKVAYDPELYQAISEYREAISASMKVKDSSWPDVIERAAALVNASRLKLLQMGVSQERIDELGKNAEAQTNLLLPADKVWVYAQVYEYEISLVKSGQRADIISAAWPGRVFKAEIRSLDPIVSSDSRTLRIKAEGENPDQMLKPGMFVELLIKTDNGFRLAVPNDSVLNTGGREFVFVETSQDEFARREVKTGLKTDVYTEIISGLKDGERIVTSANFLVDSESRMK